MSATGRGERGGFGDDFFQTPSWAVRAVLPCLPPFAPQDLAREWWAKCRILEPSAGRGAIVRELIAAGARPSNITAVEKDESRARVVADLLGERAGKTAWSHVYVGTFEEFCFRNGSASERFDVILMNPPFNVAEQHIRLANGLLAADGQIAALARLAFFAEGQCRASFRHDLPHDRLELVRRPSFTAEVLEWATEEDLLGMRQDAKKPKNHKGEWVPRLETIDEVRARLRGVDNCAYAWGLFGANRGGRFWTHEEREAA